MPIPFLVHRVPLFQIVFIVLQVAGLEVFHRKLKLNKIIKAGFIFVFYYYLLYFDDTFFVKTNEINSFYTIYLRRNGL